MLFAPLEGVPACRGLWSSALRFLARARARERESMTWMSAVGARLLKIDRFWFDEDYRKFRADIIRLHQTSSIPPDSKVRVFHTLTTDLKSAIPGFG